MLGRLQRHPFSVEAFFERSLVLTYALPRSALQPMLMPGLELAEPVNVNETTSFRI